MRRGAAGGAAIADDSGLCVDALGGAPGVISAHFARARAAASPTARPQRRAQDAANNALLLERLRGRGDRPRALRLARWSRCATPTIPSRWSRPAAGTARSLAAPRGSGGFGYDPLMFIPALGKTRRRARRRGQERAQPSRARRSGRCAR